MNTLQEILFHQSELIGHVLSNQLVISTILQRDLAELNPQVREALQMMDKQTMELMKFSGETQKKILHQLH